jgi:hypothetical protein
MMIKYPILTYNSVVTIKWGKVVRIGTLHDKYMLYKSQISVFQN